MSDHMMAYIESERVRFHKEIEEQAQALKRMREKLESVLEKIDERRMANPY